MLKSYFIISILMAGFIFPALAQDTLYMNNGVKKFVKIEEIGPTVVRYKKSGDLNGPTFTVATNTIEKIILENGKIEMMSEYSGRPVQPPSITPAIIANADDSLKEAQYRKNRNYISTNFIEMAFLNANLEYDHLFRNNVLALHFNILYGVNSDSRAKNSTMNPWKKHFLSGIGLKVFVSPKNYKNQFYISPLVEGGLLSFYTYEIKNQYTVVYKVKKEPLYIFSMNMGNVTNLTPNLFIDFNGGIGLRSQYTSDLLGFDDTVKWIMFPTVKFGFKIGFRI